ncbi:MAG TPA: cupin domain-containing protein [Planctomycetota bacterium]|nr:cupin domain-containing protein [Planctomycetota bacterium]
MKIAPHLGPHGMKGQYVISAPELGVPLITEVEWRGFSPGGAHSHHECQMLCVLSGDMQLDLGGRKFELSQGGIAILPPGVEHRVQSRGGMRFLDLRFTRDAISPLAALEHLFEGQAVWHAPPRSVAALPREFRAAYDAGGAPGIAAAMSAVWKLVTLMLQSARTSLRAESKASRYVPADRRLAQAEGFVRDHLASPLTVEHIAEHVGISRS